MTCPYCGKEVAPGSRYCLHCGTRQEPEYIPEEISTTRMPEPMWPEIQIPEFPAMSPMGESSPAAAPGTTGTAWPEFQWPEFQMPESLMPKSPAAPQPAEPQPASKPAQATAPAAPQAPAPKTASKPAAVKPKLREVNKLTLPTKRSLAKMFFLGIITLGIYPVVIWSRIVTELNIAASRHDGRRTMPYFAMVTLTPVTLGILPLVWMHNFCCRIGDELNFRRINYRFAPRDFWLWNVLGSLILVGPFIFIHKLMKAMNMVNDDFNRCG